MEIGKTLKEAREARGLTLEAVEEETKIRRKYLKALEEEQFQILPGPIYAKAFLKNYARFLNINVEEALETFYQQFPAETADEADSGHTNELITETVPGKPRYWLYVAVAVVVAGLAFSVYYAAGGVNLNRFAGKTGQEVKQGEPSPAPPRAGEQLQVQQPPASPAGVQMVLNVKNKTSWVRVTVDGTPAFQGEMSAGQSKNFEGKEKVSVRLGNAGAVEVLVNGKSQGFLGGNGEVVEREYTSQTGS